MFGRRKRPGMPIDTLIGAGTQVTGNLEFSGGLHLDGRIIGDICGKLGDIASLTVGGDAVIEGSVSVDELILNGKVLGDVVSRERVELGAAAQVDGNLSYKVLEMAAGARVNGRLIHQPGSQPGGPAALPPPEAPGED